MEGWALWYMSVTPTTLEEENCSLRTAPVKSWQDHNLNQQVGEQWHGPDPRYAVSIGSK
jgi:hypothetical protein